jgi:hypothetical protein
MDQVVQELLIGLISNGLSELAAHRKGGAEPISDDAIEVAVNGAVNRLTDIEAILPSLGGEKLREFLRSAEAHNVIRQIFASTNAKELDVVETEFYELWRSRTKGAESARPEVNRLFRSLVDLCQSSLDTAIASGNLTAIEARAAQRHVELRGAIEGLNRSLGMLDNFPALDPAEIDDYAAKYRRQLLIREGTITPPALDSARQVPIDSLYVPGRLEAVDASRTSTIGYTAFGETLFRRVVLGNPGSGKSTLAKKLAADLARDKLSLGHRPPGIVPFLVVLRDFGAHKREAHCSIVDFIATTSNSRYQLPPPPGAIEYLLLTNRAIVIFDGLDELLDTSYRTEISGDVESFASLYPGIPILATSREVGYQQAPLSPDTFSAFRLAPFSDPQIEQYARNWFGLSEADSDAKKQAEAFMNDSIAVSDLRSNALMLGLMCNLYKGTGYIPRNRPDVYEACAIMLFDRWDRLRQIGKPLNIESLLRPAMQHLAAWIYADAELQSGVTERDLIETTSSFLLDRRFERREDAELEATRFIELCRGRAWVFTDTGTTPSGERLYQFTHRTFLEFFTAGHLVRTNPTPEKLLEVLRPHISVKEWDVVAQLAFQLLDHNVEGAADVLLTKLSDSDTGGEDKAVANCLDFAARSLEFLVPSPAITKRLVTLVFDRFMRAFLPKEGASEHYTGQDPVDTVIALLGANPENSRPIVEGFQESVGHYLRDPNVAVEAAEFALNLSIGITRPKGPGDSSLANDVERELLNEHRGRLGELAVADKWIGLDLLLCGEMDVASYVALHGLEPIFQARPYAIFPNTRRISVAEILLDSRLLQDYSDQAEIDIQLALLSGLAPHLPVSEMSEIDSDVGTWLTRTSTGSAEDRGVPTELSADQTYSVLMLLAALSEHSYDGRPLEIRGEPLMESLIPILRARGPGDIDTAVKAAEELGLTESQLESVLAWIRGGTSAGETQ